MWNRLKKHPETFFPFLLVLFLTFFAVLLSNAGYDYFWHVRVGELIVTHGVPSMDPFSWYGVLHQLPWIAHEWLSEVVLFVSSYVFGDKTTSIVPVCFFFFLLGMVFFVNRKNVLKNILFTFIWGCFALFTLGGALTPRPHLFSYAFFLIVLILLYDFYHHPNSKKIYFLPIISLLWVNFHGGSSNLSYLLVSMFFLSELFTRRLDWSKAKKYGIIFILTFLSIFLNPYGIEMIFYPYSNMADGLMKSMIVEWQAPSLSLVGDWGRILFLVVTLFFIIRHFKKYQLIDLFLFGSFFLLSCSAIRFFPFLYLAMSFFVFVPIKESKISNRGYHFLNFILLFITILSLFSFSDMLREKEKSLVPDEMIAYLKQVQPKRLYNYYDYGGYLIYSSIPVFFDGRADVYSENILKDGYELPLLRGNTDQILRNYQFDYLIFPSKMGLNSYLRSQDDKYLLVMEMDDIVLYQKVEL